MYTYIVYVCVWVRTLRAASRCTSVSFNLVMSHLTVEDGIWQFPLEFLHPQSAPNQETQNSRYLAAQIQIEILIGRAAAEGLQPRRCRAPPEVPSLGHLFSLSAGPEFWMDRIFCCLPNVCNPAQTATESRKNADFRKIGGSTHRCENLNLNLNEEFEFLDLVDFGGMAFWVETVVVWGWNESLPPHDTHPRHAQCMCVCLRIHFCFLGVWWQVAASQCTPQTCTMYVWMSTYTLFLFFDVWWKYTYSSLGHRRRIVIHTPDMHNVCMYVYVYIYVFRCAVTMYIFIPMISLLHCDIPPEQLPYEWVMFPHCHLPTQKSLAKLQSAVAVCFVAVCCCSVPPCHLPRHKSWDPRTSI